MATTVTATIRRFFQAVETRTLGLDFAGDLSVTHTLGLTDLALSATSTPAVTAVWSDSITLSAGAASIDLTAMTSGSGEIAAVDFTTKKVHALIASCPAANTAFVEIKPGATNAYEPFGATNTVDLHPGGMVMLYQPEILADVSATVKSIDLASTDVDAVINIIILAG